MRPGSGRATPQAPCPPCSRRRLSSGRAPTVTRSFPWRGAGLSAAPSVCEERLLDKSSIASTVPASALTGSSSTTPTMLSEAYSEPSREKVKNFFRQTLLSRLNNPSQGKSCGPGREGLGRSGSGRADHPSDRSPPPLNARTKREQFLDRLRRSWHSCSRWRWYGRPKRRWLSTFPFPQHFVVRLAPASLMWSTAPIQTILHCKKRQAGAVLGEVANT